MHSENRVRAEKHPQPDPNESPSENVEKWDLNKLEAIQPISNIKRSSPLPIKPGWQRDTNKDNGVLSKVFYTRKSMGRCNLEKFHEIANRLSTQLHNTLDFKTLTELFNAILH